MFPLILYKFDESDAVNVLLQFDTDEFLVFIFVVFLVLVLLFLRKVPGLTNTLNFMDGKTNFFPIFLLIKHLVNFFVALFLFFIIRQGLSVFLDYKFDLWDGFFLFQCAVDTVEVTLRFHHVVVEYTLHQILRA